MLPRILTINAVTLRVASMSKSIEFYRDILGLKLCYGGNEATFSSFEINGSYLNLQLSEEKVNVDWGRVIFYSDNVDEMFARLKSRNCVLFEPRNARWGERYFHFVDPDGHEISIAQPLKSISD